MQLNALRLNRLTASSVDHRKFQLGSCSPDVLCRSILEGGDVERAFRVGGRLRGACSSGARPY